MNYPNNYKKYPNNIYESKSIVINGRIYKVYKASFNSLYDIYSFLKSDPKTNDYVFPILHSETNEVEFSGISYNLALEELMSPPRSGFKNFLTLTNILKDEALDYVQEYIEVKSPGGGYIDIPSYVSGNPFCFRTSRKVLTPKFIRMNIALNYNCGTSKKQVLNRALIIAALVNSFEKNGYMVDLNTFEVSEEGNEIVNINVNIKNGQETLNKAALYKCLCYVEFFRRLMFRVKESLDVKNDWGYGYGRPSSEKMVRAVLKLDENDIFIDQPSKMGIYGEDIGKDFENVIRRLNIEEKLNLESSKENLRKDVKRLEKTIK